MAKLSVFFKGQLIQTGWFGKDTIRIGRNKTNDLSIDSLAVAPFHAVIMIRNNSCAIKKLNDDYWLMLNSVHIEEAPIKDNDTLFLGKHRIVFNTTEAENPLLSSDILDSGHQEFTTDTFVQSLQSGSFQILDGEDIGKIIPIKKNITPLGLSGNGIVAVTKRKNGYFISVLENNGTITLNDLPLNNASFKLNHNDILVINNRSLQFFLGR